MIVLYQPFQNRTIPRKSPTPLPPLSKGGGLTARHKLSLCCIFTCDTSAFFIHQTFCRQDGGIALRPPTSQSPQPSQKHINRFAPHHVLASLVKGEVLSPKKIRATTGGIVTPPIATSPTLPKPHYPSKTTNTLASLVKGRWIDGKAQAFILLLSACATSAFFIHQTFLPSRRRDC